MLSSTAHVNAVAYVNGHVFTVDEKQPLASAFIVSPDGLFSKVGSTQEITELALKESLIIYDLRGQFIMPGIHDAHTHLLSASMQQLNESRIGFGSTYEDIAENIKTAACACAYAHVWGDWMIANFYSFDKFPDGKPDRKYLDEAFPDTPVLVRDPTCHNILMNTEGLKRAGYDLEVKEDPVGGSYVRRSDGEMTGELVEVTTRKAWLSLPTPALAHVKRALLYGIQMCHRYGITSCQEASANTIYLHALRELENEGKLSLDIHPHIVCAPENFAQEKSESLHALLDIADEFRSKHAITRFVKFWMDGAPLPPHFTQCDLDDHGCPDAKRLLVDRATLLEAITKYDSRGMTCKIHVAGEGSARFAIDVIEEVRRKQPGGIRHEIAHCNAIHADDVPRLQPLNITAEMSPAMFHEKEILDAYPNLFKWPFNKIRETGALMTIGSDWFLPETPNLFPSIAAIVEKIGSAAPDDGRPAKERGGKVLCRIITLGGAEAVSRAHETGSIEVGKTANFIAVDRDLSRGEFDGAQVMRTWFEGHMVFSRDADGNSTFVA